MGLSGGSSHDGKLHGNRQMVDAYDKDHGHRKTSQRPKESGGESGGVHEASGHDEIKQVVAEHGPAHKVVIEHDHDAGEHHVTSHHEDGHVQHATHDSAAMAHAHAAHAGGVSDGNDLKEAHDGNAMNDTDHFEANAGTHERAGQRHQIERHAGANFMEE